MFSSNTHRNEIRVVRIQEYKEFSGDVISAVAEGAFPHHLQQT